MHAKTKLIKDTIFEYFLEHPEKSLQGMIEDVSANNIDYFVEPDSGGMIVHRGDCLVTLNEVMNVNKPICQYWVSYEFDMFKYKEIDGFPCSEHVFTEIIDHSQLDEWYRMAQEYHNCN